MKFSLKKAIASTGAAALLAGITAPGVAAATPENETVEEVSQSNIEELEQFVTVNSNDTLTFDSATALEQGYDENLVSFLEQNVEQMNNLVINHEGILDPETLTVTVYPDSGITTYSGGVTTIEQGFGGLTQYYLNANDTQQLINDTENGIAFLESLGDIVGAGGIVSGVGDLSLGPVRAAASGGNGIIINQQPTSNTGVGAGTGPNVWVTSQ